MDKNTPYLKAIKIAIPQVLSMLDREPISLTYGCADRVFWAWKFIDFPGARFQEIAYFLAGLNSNKAQFDSEITHNETIIRWTKASILFWSTLQHKDGSFDEAYPYERSLAATAFTGFYVGQAFIKMQHHFSKEERSILMQTFVRAGNWLCCHDEKHGILSNHLAAAAAALDTITTITSDSKYETRRDYFIKKIMKHQSEEGWYEEYGGADPGYQTHTTFYLAHIWKKNRDQTLLKSLHTSIQYFWYFVHVDGSVGGEYASRNTRFFMPAGFEILASTIPEAASIIQHMQQAISNQRVVGIHAIDAYNIFPLLNNYLIAHDVAIAPQKINTPALPFVTHSTRYFAASGHVVISTPHYQGIIGTSKGGTLNIYPKNGSEPYSNAGVTLEFDNGKKISTQGLHCSKTTQINEHCIEISTHLVALNQMVLSPLKLVIFRATSLLSKLLPKLSYQVKKVMVYFLVSRKKPSQAQLIRRISWDDKNISVTDKLQLQKTYRVKNIHIGGRFSAIHMGSSRYFEWQELLHPVVSQHASQEQIQTLNKTQELIIQHQWSVI